MKNILSNSLVTLILAAGQGKRAGKPKWQLVYDGRNFLEIIISKLLKIEIGEICVVVREDSKPKSDPKFQLVINPKPESGMISSVYYGVRAVKNSHPKGYLIFPVDHPFVAESTLRQLIEVFLSNLGAVVIPVYNNHSGHPIILPFEVATRITEGDYSGGLKQFILDQKVMIKKIEVDDPNILVNVNELSQLQSDAK